MIKLKFHLPKPVEKTFSSTRVIIGLKSEDIADIPLDTSSLQPEHVILVEEESGFYAINRGNDPFVTLNGRPFGKKGIHSGDRLAIDDLQISFEGESSIPQHSLTSLEPLLERKMQQMPFERGFEERESGGWFSQGLVESSLDTEVQALLQQVEALEKKNEEEKSSIPVAEEDIPLFDEPLGVSDVPMVAEPALNREADHPPVAASAAPIPLQGEGVSKGSGISSLLPIGVAFLLMVALSVLGIYAAFSDQTDEQEFIAAQDVSDVAMALTYAQLHQVTPQHQNWADPEFIKLNLEKVLDGRFETALGLDSQGYLKNSPYMLRIYTNVDLSRFLLVAQSAPSIWHWFTREKSILMDSEAMELRLTTDLRAMNRLMANPSALGASGLEVATLVRDAELIPLKILAKETGRLEFEPPKNLSILRPGTEDLVENAPRYYRLTEPIVQALAQIDRAISVEARDEQIQALKERLKVFSRLPSLVLYTAGDEQTAQQAAHALKLYFPAEKWLVGYLVFDEVTGMLQSSQLVDGVSQIQSAVSVIVPSERHPVLQAMQAVALRRRVSLEPLHEEMLRLLQQQSHAPSDEFYHKMVDLLSRYQTVDEPLRKEEQLLVTNLYQDHVLKEPLLAQDEFKKYAAQAGLGAYLPEEMPLTREVVAEKPISEPPNLDVYMSKIREARTLTALDMALTAARQQLTWGSFPDLEKYMAYENRLRQESLARLEEMLLSSKSPLNSSEFHHRNKAVVLNILNKAGLTDTHERDFYLEEFDLLVDRYDRREWRPSSLHKNFFQE